MGARATATQATAMNSFEEAPVDDNRFGKLSELRVRAEARGGRTAVPELYATMPFKVMHPLPVPAHELPGLVCAVHGGSAGAPSAVSATPTQVMVMSVSAGIMAGDHQRIDVRVGAGAALQMTTQAFEKIHRMDDGASASRQTRLAVEAGAYLDYSPCRRFPLPAPRSRAIPWWSLPMPRRAWCTVRSSPVVARRAASASGIGATPTAWRCA